MDTPGIVQDAFGQENYGYDNDEVEAGTNSTVMKRREGTRGLSDNRMITLTDTPSTTSPGPVNPSIRSDNEVCSKVIPPDFKDPVTTEMSSDCELVYTVEDVPPWYYCIFLGSQNFIMMIGTTIPIPFVLTPLLCISEGDPARGNILCSIIFVGGLVTLLQTTLGVRLPIVQGGTYAFMVPTIATLVTKFEPCSVAIQQNMTASQMEEVWQVRIREIQGAIIMSSFFQIVLGFTGLMGLLMRWITPLTIVPTVTLVGLPLFDIATDKASLNWGISSLTVVLLIVFSQYMKEVPVPFPVYKKGAGCTVSWLYLFKIFPILLAVLISWLVCGILTAAGALAEGDRARTDLNVELLNNAPWFRVPYPGQWGVPSVSAVSSIGMIAGVIASIIESIGDYYACARITGLPPPPVHAVNRGIGIEGLGCLLAGLWGTGNGTTSYTDNIAAIGVTKVGSRRVVQFAAGIMIVFGVLGKFGAAIVSIPDPIVGGMFLFTFSMIAAVGLSSLQYVNLSSSRNIFVVGFSIFFGVALPKWFVSNPGVIQTGNETVNQILTVLLQTSMLVGGFLGCFLDNTIPGTPEERGLLLWNSQMQTSSPGKKDTHTSSYDLPVGMDIIRKMTWTKYLPFSPTFTGFCNTRRTEKQ